MPSIAKGNLDRKAESIIYDEAEVSSKNLLTVMVEREAILFKFGCLICRFC